MNAMGIDDNFNRNFLISLGLHGALLLCAFLGGKVVMSVFKNNDVEIIRASVRVDVVGMPKFTIKELREMQNNAAPVTEVAKGPKEVAKPKEDETPDVIKKDDLVIQEAGKVKKRNSFLNMVSDYSSKKVDTKERKQGKDGTGNKDLKSLVIEGNRISKGSALVGDFSDEAGSEFASYVQGLPEMIREFWKLPDWLMNKDLRCRVKIYLSNTGQVLKLEVHESSGEPDFDARAVAAIRATTFPKPTEAVAVRLSNSGIILGFPL